MFKQKNYFFQLSDVVKFHEAEFIYRKTGVKFRPQFNLKIIRKTSNSIYCSCVM